MSQFIQALSIFVAYYPEHPQPWQMKAMHQFLRIFFLVLDYPHLTMPKHRGRINRQVVKSRTQLSHWLERSVKLNIWYEAALTLQSPEAWGPIIWRFLHAVSDLFCFPKRRLFVLLLVILPDLLPCPKCARSFRQLLLTNQVGRRPVRTKGAFIALVKKLHLQVSAHVNGAKKK